ncbi:MAG: response regulator transcription factor [Clostridia bacterium]
MINILLVEDDSIISSSIKYYLTNEGFNLVCINNIKDGIENIKSSNYDLILLDVTLNDGNGFDMFYEIKKIKDIPVIFLTALDEEINIVRGLEMGADDYITKPFKARELLSRIKNVLRHCSSEIEELKIFNITINTRQAKVYKNSEIVFLTALEYKLLLTLVENRKNILSREQILANIWDVSEDFVNDNTLSVYIKRLREKIEDDISNPKIIITVRSVGYKIGE